MAAAAKVTDRHCGIGLPLDRPCLGGADGGVLLRRCHGLGRSGMLRGDGCIAFAHKYGLKVCTISDLTAYLEKTHPSGPFPGPQVDEV